MVVGLRVIRWWGNDEEGGRNDAGAEMPKAPLLSVETCLGMVVERGVYVYIERKKSGDVQTGSLIWEKA